MADLYKDFGDRKDELIALHKANGLAERSSITGINKYYPDNVARTRTGIRQRDVRANMTCKQEEKLKPKRTITQKALKDKPAKGGSIVAYLKKNQKIIEILKIHGARVQDARLKFSSQRDRPVPAPIWEKN